MNRLAIPLLVCACSFPVTAAVTGNVPQWKLGIELQKKVASSHFQGIVTHRYTGLKTRLGEQVTLRVDRRTRCTRRTGARTVVIGCGSLGSLVAARAGLQVIATGQFETGHFGAIGFVARTLVVR